MSLLDDASIVITPNGVKVSTLFAVIPSDGAADMDFTRATTATRIDERGFIVNVDDGVPRIDYEGGGCPHILAEPQRTNVIEYSEDFTQSYWGKNLVTVTANSLISPSGDLNASLIQETVYSSSIPSFALQNATTLSAGTYIYTFYVKNNIGRYLGISFGANSQRVRTNFDFDTETFKTLIFSGTTTGSASFTTLGDYYRITITATFPSSTNVNTVLMPLATDTYPYYDLQDSDNRSFYLWGVDVQEGSYPTSYIPTNGSTVTRNQELLFKDGITSLLGQTEGVYYHEIDIKQPTGLGVQTIFKLTPSSGDFSTLYVDNSGNLKVDFYPAGTLAFTLDGGVISAGVHQIAIQYKAGDYVMFLNGSEVQSSSDATAITQDIDKIEIVNTVYGWREIIQIYDTILTPTQLAALTSGPPSFLLEDNGFLLQEDGNKIII